MCPKSVTKLQEKPPDLKREHPGPALNNKSVLIYFYVGHFRLAGFGSGSAFTMIRLNVINADLNRDPQHSLMR
jgi:hypothetical protein